MEYLKELATPILITLITTYFIDRVIRKKNREKTTTEIELLKNQIENMKRSFHPVVLSILQTTQDKLLEDKINTLKDLANFRIELFSIDQQYAEGDPLIDNVSEYYQYIYERVGLNHVNELRKIVAEKGYFFSKEIKDLIAEITYDITKVYDFQRKNFSKQNRDIPNEAEKIIDKLSGKFENVMYLIQEDLNINNTFIQEFIEKYREL